jgi:hypothetical protein
LKTQFSSNPKEEPPLKNAVFAQQVSIEADSAPFQFSSVFLQKKQNKREREVHSTRRKCILVEASRYVLLLLWVLLVLVQASSHLYQF